MNQALKILQRWRLIAAIGFIFLIFSGQTGCGAGAPEKQSHLSGKYRGYNLVILVLDTLRADHLGCYGYIRDTSPKIDELARRSILYENAFASIPITLPSHASILTGLYPQNSGLLYNYGQLPENIPILSSILKDDGYRTGAVVSTAVLKRSKKLDRGFDEYYHNFDMASLKGDDPDWKAKGVAEDANRFAYDWLDKIKDDRFFLFINYYDTHAPFIIKPGYWNMFSPDSDGFIAYLKEVYPSIPQPHQKRRRITRYDRSLAYLDNQVDRLIEYLKKLGVLDKTIIIITSDHGNGLYQHHDYWSHGLYLFDEQIKIPFLLVLPDGTRDRISDIVETVDIMPTVLDLLGIPLPDRLDGKSTIPLLGSGSREKPDPAFAMSALQSPEDKTSRKYCVRTPESKLIFRDDGGDEFYDLDKDPFEKEDLLEVSAGINSRKISTLKKAGLNWVEGLDPKPALRSRPDSQTLKELKALGYMQ